jgi:ribosome-binding factor A
VSGRRSPRHRGTAARAAGARYPRSARVNEVLREVIAETLERYADSDDRLQLLTVTAVECDPDFARARVLLASLSDAEREALEGLRVRFQASISRQVRLKRTPLLSFAADPAVHSGRLVEDILRNLDYEPAPEVDPSLYLDPTLRREPPPDVPDAAP